tara:strand:- start:95 stop:445 length:351 start_codon:yes stop_codon:yes gene_type:complete
MLTRAKIWYGDREVRLESDGVCALEIYYTGNPRIKTDLQYKQGSRKILIWNNYDDLFIDETLFSYGGKLKILRVTAIDWGLNIVNASLNIENVHLWELIKSDWDYLGQWTGLRRGY